MGTWELVPSELWARRLKRYLKKQPNEMMAMLNHLDTCVKALNDGVSPASLPGGFIHPEPHGVVAVDQRGARGSAKEMRAYFFADEAQHRVHLITIGEKKFQSDDIADCNRFVLGLRRGG